MIENDIYKKLCKIPDFYWMRIESTTGSGIPDLNGIHNGIEFWVELKIGTPRLRPAQVAWHTRAKAQGRRVFVLTWHSQQLGHYQLYQPTRFGPIGTSHFTPLDGTLYRGSILEAVTSLLTTT